MRGKAHVGSSTSKTQNWPSLPCRGIASQQATLQAEKDRSDHYPCPDLCNHRDGADRTPRERREIEHFISAEQPPAVQSDLLPTALNWHMLHQHTPRIRLPSDTSQSYGRKSAAETHTQRESTSSTKNQNIRPLSRNDCGAGGVITIHFLQKLGILEIPNSGPCQYSVCVLLLSADLLRILIV